MRAIAQPDLTPASIRLMKLVFDRGLGSIPATATPPGYVVIPKTTRMQEISRAAWTHYRDEGLSAARVASMLKISVRTLHKECADHQTSFSQLLKLTRLLKSVSGEIEMTGLLREPFGIVLICFIKGGARLETTGRAMLVNAGDIVVLRTWQRVRLDMADASDLIAIHMRLAFLHEDDEDDDRSGAALVSATDIVQPSFVFYNMIVRALTTFVKAHKGKPVDATHIDMLRGVLNLAFSASALTAKDGRGERAGRMAAITREVIVNIGDHKLSPTIVADKLGISTRTLFHEMEREGTSFTAIVASIRLDFAAYRLFRDTDRSGPRR